jgi:hypothetical protein
MFKIVCEDCGREGKVTYINGLLASDNHIIIVPDKHGVNTIMCPCSNEINREMFNPNRVVS